MVQQGYGPQAAHPWSESDVVTVLVALDTQIEGADGIQRVKLMRDAFTMTILWETCSRGATAVAWRLEDIWIPSGALRC
jgi:hypothetical protein